VNLAMAACLLYLGVWLLRRWQGFCSRVMVGLGTIGFVVVLVAFFAPRLFQRGFHVF
jgi:hypothetical protein